MTSPSNSKPSSSRDATPPGAPSPEPGFEHSLEQVEAIIDRIERGEVGLEDSLKEYERGVQLIRRCRAILQSAQQRVEELTDRMLAADDSASTAPPGRGPENPG